MSRPAFGGTSGGGIHTFREFIDFMAQLRTERSDFRPEVEWDDGSVLSFASSSSSASGSDNAIADSVLSDNTAYSPLSLDTASESSNYSSFDEMFSPNYYSAEESEYDLSDADNIASAAGLIPAEDGIFIDEAVSVGEVVSAYETVSVDGAISVDEVVSIDEAISVDEVVSTGVAVSMEEAPDTDVDVTGDSTHDSQDVHCSHCDVATCNRDRSPSPRRPMKRRASSSDGDAARCSICMDAWSGGGEHRVVALACGHVFGYGCIRKWLLGKTSHYRCCPTCKMRASLYDIRYLRPTLVPAPEAGDLRREVQSAAAEMDRITDALCRSNKRRNTLQGKVRQLKAKLGVI